VARGFSIIRDNISANNILFTRKKSCLGSRISKLEDKDRVCSSLSYSKQDFETFYY